MYWFYMLKETDGYSSKDLEKDVFIAENRDSAKHILKEKFNGIPFRKPKTPLMAQDIFT